MKSIRTGNAIMDVIIQVAVIAIIAAIITWILGALEAPGIIATIIWILALVLIAMVILQLWRGGNVRTSPRDTPR